MLTSKGLPGWFPPDFAADPILAAALLPGPPQDVELGWRFDPAEARDAHGQWTRSGAGYAAPDHARLILPHAPKNSRFPFYKAPEDHPFFAAHPVSSKNIVASYDASTEGERAQGMRWYADAGLLAKAIAHGDAAKGAGLLASYSPQAPWPANMFNAARSMELGRAIGHEEGMITHSMQDHAQRILNGEPNDQVFTKNSAPKIRAFARLIEHGGDEPGEQLGSVVIDRHAMSVAMGTRLPKKEADTAPIGTDRYYQHVADQYRLAALEISKRGTPITPHQVQAITWLHQQAANAAQDAADIESGHGTVGAGHGRRVMQENAWKKWNAEASAEHLPVHQGTTALAGIAAQALELAGGGWLNESRDSYGRWTRFGGVGKAADTMSRNREGFSVSVRSGGEPASGYMVAQTDHTHVYPASVLNDHRQLTRAIDDLLIDEKDAFAGGNTYLGGWVHDGKLWLEPSDNIADREHAVSEGTSRNQIAVWDVEHGQEIDTGGSGGGRITEHANPEGDRGPGTGGLRDAARGGAAGDRSQPGQPHPGGLDRQLDLSWKDSWLHERRAPDGRWVHGGGLLDAPQGEGYPVTFHRDSDPVPRPGVHFDPALNDFVMPDVRAAAVAEVQKDLRHQHKYVPGVADHEVVILADHVPADYMQAGAQGQTMEDGTVYMRADNTAAISGVPKLKELAHDQVDQGWWVPVDKHWTSGDVVIAHETGHIIGERLEKANPHMMTSLDYWGPLASAMGLLPPREGKRPGRTTGKNLSEWAYRNSYALQAYVSQYGASNPYEMQGELWSEYTMSSHPRPAAKAFGQYVLTHLPAEDLPPRKAAS